MGKQFYDEPSVGTTSQLSGYRTVGRLTRENARIGMLVLFARQNPHDAYGGNFCPADVTLGRTVGRVIRVWRAAVEVRVLDRVGRDTVTQTGQYDCFDIVEKI